MDNYIDRIKKLDNNKLIDIVKNYKQYNYNEAMRAEAIAVLEERGVTMADLRITGNLENKTYNHAMDLYKSYNRNANIAFILYLTVLFSAILVPVLDVVSITISKMLLTGSWMALVFYFIYLGKSFLVQNQFYHLINQNYGTENALLYLLAGMPFYIVMHFFFKNQMKEKLKEVV